MKSVEKMIGVELGKYVPGFGGNAANTTCGGDSANTCGRKALMECIDECLGKLTGGELDFTGWVDLPEKIDPAIVENVKAAAKKINETSDLLIVIGIGGSYLGAKAVIEALAPQDEAGGKNAGGQGCGKNPAGATKVVFAGNCLSAHYHRNILRMIENHETSICVISKSGTTAEPALAFSIIKDALIKKYGESAAMQRIYAITDEHKGALREETNLNGYTNFIVPDDIGGRYSVLTPVGLLPIAAAGIDIDQLLEGARFMRGQLLGDGACNMAIGKDGCNMAQATLLKYAAARYLLTNAGDAAQGNAASGSCGTTASGSCGNAANGACGNAASGRCTKTVEIFEYYEPRIQYFGEWLKQLFGESEGKKGLGIFPASLQFSTDLHSMGQFLQEGRPIFFETLIDIADPGEDLDAPDSAEGIVKGHTMNEVERAAIEGVIRAHESAKVPVIRITVPDFSEFSVGQMIYFFEMNCAVTALLTGVDPFNQPGVEAYKAEMKSELAK